MNRRFVLRERPAPTVTAATFERADAPVPELADGEALVHVRWISVDPSNRAWLDPRPTYVPAVAIGEVMRGRGLGRVVASKSADYRVGELVLGFTGWQDYAIASARAPLLHVTELPDVAESAYLGVFGMTGFTAWLGITDIGRPAAGETVVVSAAAGAVGSIAGQLARSRGARVVGIVGGADKCRLLVEQLGFAAAVDYRASDWDAQLAAATPDGIDVDFENVGGPVMNAVFQRLNLRARVALCGLIATYNGAGGNVDAAAFARLVIQRVHLQGFLVLDHLARMHEATRDLHALVGRGEITPIETILDGFDALPGALAALFTGGNVGKLVVQLAAK